MNRQQVATVVLLALAMASAILVARSFDSVRRAEPFDARHDLLNERLGACGKTIRCAFLSGGSAEREGGAKIVLTSCDVKPAEEIGFRALWGSSPGSAHLFAWTTSVQADAVFPLHGVLAQLIHCQVTTGANGSPPGPLAELEMEPAGFAWLAPAPENVFVPFEGEATLDLDDAATATLDAVADAAHVPSVTIHITRDGEPRHTYEHLHAGHRFPWAQRQATIVRIVEPRSPIVGWVEVALPVPEESGVGQRSTSVP